uniref:Vomeronasal type-1 receptor n=1 Tax=Romanomermis culicivorax TaxID=13658 RepID=A0A915JX76_ROMCU
MAAELIVPEGEAFHNLTESLVSCEEGHPDLLFTVFSGFLLVASVIGQFTNVVFVRVLIKSTCHVPYNVKAFLILCNSMYFARCLCFTVKFLYNACILYYGFEIMKVSRLLCIVCEYFYLTPSVISYFCVLMVSFDRLKLTFTESIAGMQTSHAYFGCNVVFVCVLNIIFSSVVYLTLSVTSHVSAEENVCYCYVIVAWDHWQAANYSRAMLGVQVVICATFLLTNWTNKRAATKFKINALLMQRYSKWWNITVTHWLVHSCVHQAVGTMIMQISITIGRTHYTDEFTMANTNFNVACLCLFSIEACTNPVIFLKNNVSLMGLARKTFPWLFRSKIINRFVFGIHAGRVDSADLHRTHKQSIHWPKSVTDFSRLRPPNSHRIKAMSYAGTSNPAITVEDL